MSGLSMPAGSFLYVVVLVWSVAWVSVYAFSTKSPTTFAIRKSARSEKTMYGGCFIWLALSDRHIKHFCCLAAVTIAC